MKAHDLAEKLLNGPNLEVAINSDFGEVDAENIITEDNNCIAIEADVVFPDDLNKQAKDIWPAYFQGKDYALIPYNNKEPRVVIYGWNKSKTRGTDPFP